MVIDKFTSSGRLIPEAVAEEKQLQELFSAYKGVDDDYVHAGRAALERWWDWKFGLRIHWSIYSILARNVVGESWLLTRFGLAAIKERKTLPMLRAQYEELYKWWNPSLFNAEQWCDMMARAGMKFFTFTMKHHDGFSMYDTKTRMKKRRVHIGPDAGNIIDCDTHYSIMDTPFKRDVARELVEAGRRHNLGIGLYFSHIDWFDSDFRIDEWNYQRDENYTRQSNPEGFARMIARHREQIREICTNYGKVDLLSLDMHFPKEAGIHKDIIETVKMARRLQPDMLMRRRGIDPYGDYKTPEGVVPSDPQAAAGGQNMPWQVIYPGGEYMSYVWGDEYKPAEWIVENLVDITAKGGNFQVGYGPGPDGTWDKTIINRLEEVGNWLKVNGEGIYATRPYKTFKEGTNIRFTRTKNQKYVYAFILKWPDEVFAGGKVRLESVRAKSNSAITMLGLDHKFKYTQDEKALMIEVPEWFRDAKKRPCKMAHTFKIEV